VHARDRFGQEVSLEDWRVLVQSVAMMDVVLSGQIKRVVYVNPVNGYSVVHFVPDGRAKTEVVVGTMPSVCEGDLVKVKGRQVVDPRFGAQIKAELVEPVLPSSTHGVVRYLSSGPIHGVGKVLAERMAEFFGDALPDVLERSTERLTEVPGIGEKKAEAIAAGWQEKVASRRLLVSLYGLGVGSGLAMRVMARYGSDAFGIVRDTPYRMAREVKGVGFLTADRLAQSYGMPKDSPDRIEAGVVYYLDNQSSEGHCFMPFDRLVQECAGFLEVDIVAVEGVVRHLLSEGALREEHRFAGEDIYVPRLYNAEVDCAQGLSRLLEGSGKHGEAAMRGALERGVRAIRMELTLEQIEAIWGALTSKCAIVTGGPGTGKTTVIRALIASLRHLNEEVQLCAPTGRAAKRMTETTGVEARTIHRMLEYNPATGDFARCADHPIPTDAVIVDEVSMIDVELMSALLDSLAPGTRLVLVGDKDQLESVGPGAVLRDCIASDVVPVRRFTQIHRQAEQSLIVVNSHRVLRGEQLETRVREGGRRDFFFMEEQDPEECLRKLHEIVLNRIPSRFGLDPIRDVQVLTPMYKGLLGGKNLNESLQSVLNPEGKEARRGERLFRVSDRVMQVRNNYDKEVFNGDVGFVEGVGPGGLSVRMTDGRKVEYGDADLDELVLAYSVTVHKSQGSEYPAVVMVLHNQHYVMLRRNLFYTGLTRGKRLVVVIGSRRAIATAIRNDQTRKRHTRLAERLRSMRRYGCHD